MSTDYTIPKDEYRALVAENAKLRELVRVAAKSVSPRCRHRRRR